MGFGFGFGFWRGRLDRRARHSEWEEEEEEEAAGLALATGGELTPILGGETDRQVARPSTNSRTVAVKETIDPKLGFVKFCICAILKKTLKY